MVGRISVVERCEISEKILFVIESFLQDGYDLCDDFGQVLDRRFPKAAWAEVAETLMSRLPRDATDGRNREK